MPTYDYICPKCNTFSIIRHGMEEKPELICNNCNIPLERTILKAPSVSFKGGPPTSTGRLGGRHKWMG